MSARITRTLTHIITTLWVINHFTHTRPCEIVVMFNDLKILQNEYNDM